MTSKAYHAPRSLPCDCGIPALNHYVEHEYVGDSSLNLPCEKCQLPRSNHRINRSWAERKRVDERVRTRPGRKNHSDKRTDKERGKKYIGIDGEGQGRKVHNYVMLAASYEDGSDSWVVEPEPGKHRLSTVQCLDMLLELPSRRTRIFSYAFNYDLTKMLMDLDNKSLFELFRPELRQRAKIDSMKGPFPIAWSENKNDPTPYLLNLQGTKFTVRRGKKRTVVWDLFKFFQGKFVTALRDWKVGDKELWERMELMKSLRSEFDKLGRAEILQYCFEETRCMGQLARKLIESHSEVGLILKAYYGAGSSGGAMLDNMGIREKLAKTPLFMQNAVACAFSGGRFENSVHAPRHHPAGFCMGHAQTGDAARPDV